MAKQTSCHHACTQKSKGRRKERTTKQRVERTMVYTTKTAKETEEIAQDILNTIFTQNERIVCLHGTLGAGKTTLVKGIAKALKIEGTIKSPTYTYVNSYKMRNTDTSPLHLQREDAPRGEDRVGGAIQALYHFDLYRLAENTKTFPELEELLDNTKNLIIIEWAKRLPLLNNIGLHIKLTKEDKHHKISVLKQNNATLSPSL
jgi:tRNA threonylcarbamoyladenosine biosynthesis protein TsaE